MNLNVEAKGSKGGKKSTGGISIGHNEDAVVKNSEEQNYGKRNCDDIVDDCIVDVTKSAYSVHLWEISKLTWPIVVSELSQNALNIVDLLFVGRLPDKNDLAAAALAIVWFNILNYAMLGFCMAPDTLLSQSFGANDLDSFRAWAGTSLVIVILVSCVLSGIMAFCEPVMVLFGQNVSLSREAGNFSLRLIPGLVPYFVFKVLSKYLQIQGIMVPVVIIGIFANLFNIAANWCLIHKLELGLMGAPWATTLTRIIQLILLLVYMFWNKSRKLVSTWPLFLLKNIKCSALLPFWKLAAPGALAQGLEAWSFEILTIFAGLLGTVELDGHIITLSVATFLYASLPFAVGIASSIRVGQLIGEGRALDAKRSHLVSMGVNTLLYTSLIAVLIPLKTILGDLFTSSDDVSRVVVELIPLSCIFMLGDAIQTSISGALRGLGQQKIQLLLTTLGFWVMGVPLGAIFSFVLNVGVSGLWWGITCGVYTSSFVGVILLSFCINWSFEAERAQKRIKVPCGE